MKKIINYLLFFAFAQSIMANTLEDQARAKIQTLNDLIAQAEAKSIPTLHEKTTVRTAEIFLAFANWDEANIATNETLFKLVHIYKDNALEMAQGLPKFEREDVIGMLDVSIATLQDLIDEKSRRLPPPNVDWSEASLDGDQITFEGRPVFLQDYTWKASTDFLTEYHGDLDGFFLAPSHLEENGDIKKWVFEDAQGKGSGSLGFIFLNHKNPPTWAQEKYGPNFKMRENSYTHYDIDNPGAREMQGMILSKMVPIFKGKKYSELGYMLCNEPHFFTTQTDGKVDWASGGVSEYTFEKFRDTLARRHSSIAELNSRWGTTFSSFDNVSVSIPMERSHQGTAMWYDWVSFNRERVTEWFTALHDTIQHYDPEAKTHIKIMPNLWSENSRGHGIDLEELTRLTEIIGNDASIQHETMFGGPYEFKEHFAYEWRELCMSYDFMKSISPNKIILNSENHFLSTVRSRDLYQSPLHARSTFFLGHIWGLTANQIWFWPRKEDGSLRSEDEKGYCGSNTQQPWLTNEIHTTTLDLNTFAEDIMAMQRQKKPIRIFFSETSAINIENHMDDIFELYDHLVFEGIPIGFATKDILEEKDYDKYNVVVAHKTPYVREDELAAVQEFLDNGGTLITDAYSFKYNPYGEPYYPLKESNGKIIKLYTLNAMKDKALQLAANEKPSVEIRETNTQGRKTCLWKCVKNSNGNYTLAVINVGKVESNIKVVLNGSVSSPLCTDLISGQSIEKEATLAPKEVYFVEVKESNSNLSKTRSQARVSVYPNPTSGNVTFDFDGYDLLDSVDIYNLLGEKVSNLKDIQKQESISLNLARGSYVFKVKNGDFEEALMVQKM